MEATREQPARSSIQVQESWADGAFSGLTEGRDRVEENFLSYRYRYGISTCVLPKCLRG